MSEIAKVFQNKNKRTTVVSYEGCEMDGLEYIARRFNPVDEYHLLMPSKITGKVVCCKDDQWDDSVGKKEAYAKADRTHNKLMKAVIKRWMASVIENMKHVDENIFNDLIEGEK